MMHSSEQKLTTKEIIYEAALSILKNGSLNMMVKDICAEAKITRPTFYRYFKDVEDLTNSMSEAVLNELKKSLIIKEKTPLKEMKYNELPINIVNLFKHIEDNKVFYETFLETVRNQYFTNQLLYILEEYIKRGIDYAASKDDVLVPEGLLVSYSTGAYFNSIVWWIKNDYPYTPEEMTATLLRLSVKGPYKDGIASFIKD